MDGLSKEEVFHLNEEIDRLDTSVLETLIDENMVLQDLMLDERPFEDD
jgi:hypothetical protein